MFGAAEPTLGSLDPVFASRATEIRAAIDPAGLRHRLEQLPAPRVRFQAPDTMAAVDAMILHGFRSAGWSAELRPYEVTEVDGLQLAPILHGVNIVAVKEGRVADAIVLVAHHDTVPGTGGADDNGSGVVALLEVARLIAPLQLEKSIVLAAVDQEELGFLGSQQLVRELAAERRVVGALVFEMLAYTSTAAGSQLLPPGIDRVYVEQVRKVRARELRGDFLAIVYRQDSRALATCVAENLAFLSGAAAPVLLRAPTDLPVIGPVLGRTVPFARDFALSDHVSFWAAGLPAVQITDTAYFRNPHYHQPSDTPETLDYDCLANVIAATVLTVERRA